MPAHVYDLRGTHGSGKSYTVHTLLSKFGNEQVVREGKVIGHRLPKLQAVVLGPYTKVCGGCDAIRTQDEVCNLVRTFRRWAGVRRVILEGSLVGHTYSRYAALADELGRDQYTFLFLDTPLDECIRRVEARRAAKGNTKPLDPKNIRKDHHTTQTKLREKFSEAGYDVQGVHWQAPVYWFLYHVGALREGHKA